MGYEGNWTGKVVVQLSNQQELGKLHDTLHGKGVEIQQHLAGIAVDSLHVDLTRLATQARATQQQQQQQSA